MAAENEHETGQEQHQAVGPSSLSSELEQIRDKGSTDTEASPHDSDSMYNSDGQLEIRRLPKDSLARQMAPWVELADEVPGESERAKYIRWKAAEADKESRRREVVNEQIARAEQGLPLLTVDQEDTTEAA